MRASEASAKNRSNFDLEPKDNCEIKGEVKGKALCIYSKDPEEALKQMVHEYLEYLLAQYYLTPALMAREGFLINHAYHTKEQLIESLANIIREKLGRKSYTTSNW